MTGQLRAVPIRGGLRAKGRSPPGAFLLKTGKSAFLLEVQPSSRAKGPVSGVKSANVFAFPSAWSLSAPMDPGFLILCPFPPSPFFSLPLSFFETGSRAAQFGLKLNYVTQDDPEHLILLPPSSEC